MTDTALRTNLATHAAKLHAVSPQQPGVEVPHRRPLIAELPFAARIGIAAALGLLGYFGVFGHAIADAAAGSRATPLVVVPLLMVLIATGYRRPSRGVGDSESDWIIAAFVGVASFTAIYLLTQRMPTLSSLWHLQSLGFVVWFACLLAVLLGARHVVRMWKLWVFAVCCATPLPFLLAASALGGSDDAVALLAAGVGAVAVFLASETVRWGPRLLATAGCFVLAAVVVVSLDAYTGLFAAVIVGGGILPVATVVVLHRATATTGDEADPSAPRLPRLSPVSVAVLAVIAIALAVVNYPAARPADVPVVTADWAARAGLGAPTVYPFITRTLGADATLVRYSLPGAAGKPAAAVDVMSSPNRAALDDLTGAVWYPSASPVEYRPAPTAADAPPGARVVHSNADAATYGDDQHWYAVTWDWHAASAYQRVTVIVSQAFDGRDMPPAPAPLSLVDTSVRPALWTTRQQPHVDGEVDPAVINRADRLTRQLVRSAEVVGAPTR
ncbi:hypothetical protein H7I53_11465 [Mycolicibacterium pulveris]|uniref:Uncharacterized protein n=1 Tax=Mycolicibacterium pulveris TaxID=36813 RepID=A0A7I7UHJ7_MYCPV|nr:hypothetical protein [Mycolicibacterium pulveris]MCV6980836.1 hypothetical protein [Mycolicibacterium pulveris]BBY80580.1 hypothetical protein MPUL_17380 [Mycolicibacterium pulveris]